MKTVNKMTLVLAMALVSATALADTLPPEYAALTVNNQSSNFVSVDASGGNGCSGYTAPSASCKTTMSNPFGKATVTEYGTQNSCTVTFGFGQETMVTNNGLTCQAGGAANSAWVNVLPSS